MSTRYPRCKFCGCCDRQPCRIGIDLDGQLTDGATGIYTTCGWFTEGKNICSAPACVEKAYAEAALLADQLKFFIERSA